VGRFFSTFDEAWADFLVREEPLESFVEQFPDEEAYLTVWLVPPGAAVVEEAAAVQNELRGLEDLRLTPAHWLHVSLGHGREDDLEIVRDRLRGFGAFEAEYGPTTCFHPAVVLEARSDRFAELAVRIDPECDLSVFLPHLSVAYVDGRPDPGPVRERLLALRDRPLVRERVAEVQLCVIPVARDQLLTPWRVAGVVTLD
jgi:hypothetical protein